MDIRDVVTPTTFPDHYLDEIFKLQLTLVNEYIRIERMPQYPLKLDIKADQVIIKDLIARIVEELGEAYESFLILQSIFNKFIPANPGLHFNLPAGLLPDTFEHALYNFNEELSDALHFYMELLIFTGIYDSRDMEHILKNKGYTSPFPGTPDIPGLLIMSRHFLLKIKALYPKASGLKIVAPISDEFCRCGSFSIQKDTDAAVMHLSWLVTYYLQLARNSLKNKPWKQTGMITDHKNYYSNLYDGFIVLFGLFQYFGMTEQDVYTLYYKKNQINHFRIKSKY